MPVEEIRKLLLAKADALVRRAPDELSTLLHPGFVYVNASGTTFGKASYVDTYCRSGKLIFTQHQLSELDVMPFDGFAVATMRLNDKFLVEGCEVAGTYRSLCVFTKPVRDWLWAAGQTMPAK
jgi:hypothetical protein